MRQLLLAVLFSLVTAAPSVAQQTSQFLGALGGVSAVWVDVPFDAGDFTGSGSMTWTVEEADISTFAWVRSGKTMTVTFFLNATTVAGTPDTSLQILIPDGRVGDGAHANTVFAKDADTTVAAWCFVGDASTVIDCRLLGVGPTWTADPNDTQLRGQVTFRIQ